MNKIKERDIVIQIMVIQHEKRFLNEENQDKKEINFNKLNKFADHL